MIVSPGSAYTETSTGRVVEVFATTPFVLYSPRSTYDTEIYNSRIFQLDLEDFLARFTDIIGIPLQALTDILFGGGPITDSLFNNEYVTGN